MKTIIEAPGNLIKFYCLDNDFILVDSNLLEDEKFPDYRSGILGTQNRLKFIRQPSLFLNLSMNKNLLKLRWPFSTPELYHRFYPKVILFPLQLYSNQYSNERITNLLTEFNDVFGRDVNELFGVVIDRNTTQENIDFFCGYNDQIKYVILEAELDGLESSGRFKIAKQIQESFPSCEFLFRNFWYGLDDFVKRAYLFKTQLDFSGSYFVGDYPVRLGLNGHKVMEWRGIQRTFDMNFSTDRLRAWVLSNIDEVRSELTRV